MTDESGNVAERYAYDAYGVPTILNAAATQVLATSAENNRFMYTGQQWDEDLGLYSFKGRMYDPWSGRFCSRDPIGYSDGLNLYRAYFVPSMTDPFGTLSAKPSLQCNGCGAGQVLWNITGDGILNAGVVIQKICFKISSTKCDYKQDDCKAKCKTGRKQTCRICYFERLVNNSDSQSAVDEWVPGQFSPGSCGSVGSAHITASVRTFRAEDVQDVPFSAGQMSMPMKCDGDSMNAKGTHVIVADGDDPDWWKNKAVSKLKSYADFQWNCCTPNKSSSAQAGTLSDGEFAGPIWKDDCTKFDDRGPRPLPR